MSSNFLDVKVTLISVWHEPQMALVRGALICNQIGTHTDDQQLSSIGWQSFIQPTDPYLSPPFHRVSEAFLVTHVRQPSFRYKQFYNVQFGKGQKLFDCESSNISGEFFVSSSLLASEQTCVLGNGAR